MFENLFVKSNNKDIVGLNDELKCIYVWNLLKSNSILFVVDSLYEATNYYQALQNYTDKVLFFPMDDFLTSEALAISPELKTTRIETLRELEKKENKIVVTNLMGYLRYLPKKEVFLKKKITLKKNQDYSIKDLIEKLYGYGYTKETIVNKTGEIAVRGYVLDIFSTDSENPIRIEFFGDTIDEIKVFDVNTQLTIRKIDEIEINPNTEFLTEDNVDSFDKKYYELPNYTNVVNISKYFDNIITIYDDLDKIKQSYELLTDEILNYNKSIDGDPNRKYMFNLEELIDSKYINFSSFDNKRETGEVYSSFDIEPFRGNKEEINNRLNKYLKNNTVIICVSNRYKANKIIDDLENDNIVLTNESNIDPLKINIIIKNITKGFNYNKYIVISESEIFNKKVDKVNYKTNFRMGSKIKDITKLQNGDYVVHNTYGIGIYRGIKTLNKSGLNKDYLCLEYYNNDKLYIPVENIDLISKYASKEGSVPKINKLNSAEWEKTKLRVKKRIENIAAELLVLYAKREASVGYAFKKDNDLQLEFEKEFEYNETVDQIKAIDAVKKDMESIIPMDRLICGDVGYGKTEVAFRAMFKAVLSGKQVALLCPTTILSTQHYQNAIMRFKSFPVNIEVINRFVTPKKTKEIISKLKDGKIDILIGTHRLLSNDIVFKDLGLLIVDEEQRFGVKHKERIKELKNNIDILTLSATPIPRTLQMSLTGIRSLSLIETPPCNRYPVQTYVIRENKQIIKDAIYKEICRNGQVFILYNNTYEMDTKVSEISSLVPNAKVIGAHGKMSKTELEDIMFKFSNKEYDVLVCTTIIETGIDIPSANTLIVIDADRFGLSQLYQLRGRVGRSNKIAYCYLMYNPAKILSEIAIKRLNTIKEFTELGSGFSIAMRDLSIRGAGDILGSEQAGFIDTVGIEMFTKLLNDEILTLKGEKKDNNPEEAQPLVEVDTAVSDDYVVDEDLKIEIHKKINSIDSYEKLLSVKEELEDRFGKLNDNMIIYMHEEWFDKLARSLNINNIKQNKNKIEIIIDPITTNKINCQNVFMDSLKLGKMFKFNLKNKRFIITLDTTNLDKHFIYYLIYIVEIIKQNMK